MWKILKLTETINDYHCENTWHFMSHGPTKSEDQFKVRDLKSLWNSEGLPKTIKFEVRPKKDNTTFHFHTVLSYRLFLRPKSASSSCSFLRSILLSRLLHLLRSRSSRDFKGNTLDFPSIADCWCFLSCHQRVDLARSSLEGGTACWHHLLGLFESIWMQPMPLQ